MSGQDALRAAERLFNDADQESSRWGAAQPVAEALPDGGWGFTLSYEDGSELTVSARRGPAPPPAGDEAARLSAKYAARDAGARAEAARLSGKYQPGG